MNKLILSTVCWLMFGVTLWADPASNAKGIMFLTSASGLTPRNVLFSDLIWTDFYGGNVIDTEGQKSVFAKKDIGKIIYFDSRYYAQSDNDPQMKAFREGIQAREVVVNTSFFNLDASNDLKTLQATESTLESIGQEYPAIRSFVQQQIDLLKDDIGKLSSGQSLLNGKWMTREEANAQAPPAIGGGSQTCTFTTKDGKKYVNAKATVGDTGLSILTSDGGTTIPFDQLPDDLSNFPDKIRAPVIQWRKSINSLGVKFVPAGTNGVLFSVWDVRVKDFAAFVNATGYDATDGMFSLGTGTWKQRGDTWKNPGFMQTENDPVVGVSWDDAQAFCYWLTKKEQIEGRLAGNQEYRLPTDAEWFKAEGLSSIFLWGDNKWPPPPGVGNYAGSEARDAKWPSDLTTIDGYNDGYPRTSPVGSFPANAYGLYDMGGNVWQWSEDNYTGGDSGDDHKLSGSNDDRALHGASWQSNNALNDDRALHGASWQTSNPLELFSVSTNHAFSYCRFASIGFRVVLASNSPTASEELTCPVVGKEWTNSLGVKFVPAGTDGVLFSIWDVRVRDYAAYWRETGHKVITLAGLDGSNEENMWSIDAAFRDKIVELNPHNNTPVVEVSDKNMNDFCQWLTKKEQKEGLLAANQEYRLPTDAEWSKAAGLEESGGGTPMEKSDKIKGVYSWGTQWPPPPGAGNYLGEDADPEFGIKGYHSGNKKHHPSPVGSFAPNKYGLYDIGGNVEQCCADTYTDKNNTGLRRVIRGASCITRARGEEWHKKDNPDYDPFALSYRGLTYSDQGEDWLGFRVVLAVGSSPTTISEKPIAGPVSAGNASSDARGNSPAATESENPIGPSSGVTNANASAILNSYYSSRNLNPNDEKTIKENCLIYAKELRKEKPELSQMSDDQLKEMVDDCYAKALIMQATMTPEQIREMNARPTGQ